MEFFQHDHKSSVDLCNMMHGTIRIKSYRITVIAFDPNFVVDSTELSGTFYGIAQPRYFVF
jgi:hypothetical protein